MILLNVIATVFRRNYSLIYRRFFAFKVMIIGMMPSRFPQTMEEVRRFFIPTCRVNRLNAREKILQLSNRV
jgi:hypothetical protein